MHQPILHDQCPKIPAEAEVDKNRAKKMPKCSDIGLFLCGPSGRLVSQLRFGFYSHLKRFCAAKCSATRDALVDRRLVVKLHRGPRAEESASAWNSDSDDDAIDTDTSGFDPFWHISFTTLKPFAASFRPMKYLRSEEHDGSVEQHLEAHVSE